MWTERRPFLLPAVCLFILIPLLGFIFAECIPRRARASEAEAAGEAEWAAKVVSVEGSVEARKASETTWLPVRLDDTYREGDMIRVGELSRAAVLLQNGSVLRLDQNTVITFAGIEREETLLLKVIGGSIHFFSRKPKKLKVITPFMNAAVGGTEFIIKVDSAGSSVSVFEGTVTTENEAGSLTLTGGQSAHARKGMAPESFTVVRPRDAVHWAIYYPPVLDLQPGSFALGREREWPAAVERSLERYWENDIAGAFSCLPKEPDGISDPRFFTYRAALLLTVGRVDEAEADIAHALRINPLHAPAFALQSIVAVAQNEKRKALELARKSVEMDSGSSDAHVALSYVQQAHFELKGALESLLKAVQLSPGNPLAWARLAELRLSTGDLDGAMDAAQRAASLTPNLARTQTVLGFAHLTRIDIPHAKKSFREAIRLGQGDPLPRLGLGLAKIREGHLEEGRREMEIAVVLDPNNSLVRSYLGKAYYEEKSNRRAKEQFRTAKELDPMDPTPWFYDAIRKESVNRPVEALEDLQKSMELNDNRAVYRSRLQLDQDIAARSVGLARIYQELGFEQLALSEGWKSLSTDPANYSAHRLLADSYSALPRHEIARVSELLQAQLLQPININPVQPQLAESKLFIPRGLGPGAAALYEYNALFNRNRLALLASGIAGEKGSVGGEIVQSGVWGQFSYSLGQFHYETDGFRPNNDLSQDISNVFAQVSLTPKTSVQGEFRHLDFEFGDRTLLFDPDSFFRSDRNTMKADYTRFGLHHSFTPRSDFIASLSYNTKDSGLKSPGYSTESDEKAFGVEAQYLFRGDRFSVIAGAGRFDTDRKESLSLQGEFPPSKFNIPHTNLYAYSLINYPKNFVWNIGVSANFLEDPSLDMDRHQFNPKLGLTWTPFSGTTLRAAAFRTLKRTLITDQSIEPTQVAGFNQFFDDPNGTDAWRYGVGIDQKLSSRLYAGGEFSMRDLTALGTVVETGDRVEADLQEYLGRAYLCWTPCKWLAVSPEYQFERFKNPRTLLLYSVEELNTHRFSLGVNLFHPSGFFAAVKPTFVSQDGRFEFFPPDFPYAAIVPDDSHFFVLDAAIGFRLPNRWGLISIEAKNLFDKSFRFQDTDPANPRLIPDRSIVGKLTVSF